MLVQARVLHFDECLIAPLLPGDSRKDKTYVPDPEDDEEEGTTRRETRLSKNKSAYTPSDDDPAFLSGDDAVRAADDPPETEVTTDGFGEEIDDVDMDDAREGGGKGVGERGLAASHGAESAGWEDAVKETRSVSNHVLIEVKDYSSCCRENGRDQ